MVEFRYWSWPALVGVVASCATLLCAVIWLVRALQAPLLRRAAITVAACVCALALLIWYHSLYAGGNIGTRYTWTSENIKPHLSSQYNLAYGKKTSMTSIFGYWPHDRASSVAVDGQRGPTPGFLTDLQEEARWEIDLGQVEQLTEIVLYKRSFSNWIEQCSLPFDIFVSLDGEQWSTAKTVTERGWANHWRLELGNVKARYVRLQTRQQGRLALAEVEIYGTQEKN